MAIISNTYTGDGSTVIYSLSFPYIERAHVKATVNGTPTTAFTFVNATTIQFGTAPANGAVIVLFRDTPIDELNSRFFPNSSIRSDSLNNNFTQGLFVAQETDSLSNEAISTANGAVVTANNAVSIANGAVVTANAADAKSDQAIIDSAAAVVTANTAESNSLAAINTANLAESNSLAAVGTANSAIAAVSAAIFYTPVVDLAALALLTPTDGDFFELQDSTGADTDPSITGVPIGLAGDSGLTFRLRYDDPPGEYAFLGYFPNDSETRYAVKATEGVAAQGVSDAAAAQGDATQALLDASNAQGDATQALLDAAAAQGDATQALLDAGAAQADATQALTDKVDKAGDTMTGNLVVPSINGGPLAGFRNAIINGNFDIWQRGTSFTGSEYGADRWQNSRNGTTHTVTRQAFTLGQTDVPGEPTYFNRTVVSSVAGANHLSVLTQRIEDVRTFAGQQVTISFWAKADATKNIAVEFEQFFGTGGSPSAAVNGIGVTKVSIGTTFQKVTVTATLPSISGKTLGTDNTHRLNLVIWLDAGSNFNARTDTLGQQSGTFDIAQVQVEAGPVATPFERRPIGTELALCQRYYSRLLSTQSGHRFGTGLVITTSRSGFVITLPSTMRAVPTMSTTNNASDYSVVVGSTITSATATPILGSGSSNTAFVTLDTGATLVVSHPAMIRSTTSNAFIAFDAEI